MNIAIGNASTRSWKTVGTHFLTLVGGATLAVVAVLGLANGDTSSRATVVAPAYTPGPALDYSGEAPYMYEFYLVDSDAVAAEIRAMDKAPNTLRTILIAGTPEFEAGYHDMEGLLESELVHIEVIDLMTGFDGTEFIETLGDPVEVVTPAVVQMAYHYYLVDSDQEAAALRALPRADSIGRFILVTGTPEFDKALVDIDVLSEWGFAVEVIDMIGD